VTDRFAVIQVTDQGAEKVLAVFTDEARARAFAAGFGLPPRILVTRHVVYGRRDFHERHLATHEGAA
jgi:hypothetical protein